MTGTKVKLPNEGPIETQRRANATAGFILYAFWNSLNMPRFFFIFGRLKRKGNQNFGIKPKEIK
jgi:hypothetical protein